MSLTVQSLTARLHDWELAWTNQMANAAQFSRERCEGPLKPLTQ
jgi:hypothetical protein